MVTVLLITCIAYSNHMASMLMSMDPMVVAVMTMVTDTVMTMVTDTATERVMTMDRVMTMVMVKGTNVMAMVTTMHMTTVTVMHMTMDTAMPMTMETVIISRHKTHNINISTKIFKKHRTIMVTNHRASRRIRELKY